MISVLETNSFEYFLFPTVANTIILKFEMCSSRHSYNMPLNWDLAKLFGKITQVFISLAELKRNCKLYQKYVCVGKKTLVYMGFGIICCFSIHWGSWDRSPTNKEGGTVLRKMEARFLTVEEESYKYGRETRKDLLIVDW